MEVDREHLAVVKTDVTGVLSLGVFGGDADASVCYVYGDATVRQDSEVAGCSGDVQIDVRGRYLEALVLGERLLYVEENAAHLNAGVVILAVLVESDETVLVYGDDLIVVEAD